MSTEIHPVLLFDGDCAFCSATVQWFLHHDPAAHLHYAPYQSPTGRTILARHGLKPEVEQTVYLVTGLNTPQESIAVRSDATIAALKSLKNKWSILATLGHIVPRPLRNAAYNLIARNRKKIMRNRTCILPTDEQRARFIDVQSPAQ